MQVGDRRSTLCRKWRVFDGRRIPCSFDRGHVNGCSWDFPEPQFDMNRDPGPYGDVAQAMKQYANWSAGMPLPMKDVTTMQILEALLMTGLTPTRFEQEYLAAHGLDPILATIVHGWLLRAAHPYLRRAVSPAETPEPKP